MLHRLPAMLSGEEVDPTGYVQEMYRNLGIAALNIIQEAFLVKSQRAADEAGRQWAELAPMTIRLRRKRRQGKGQHEDSSSEKILIETERLYQSLTPPVGGVTGAVAAGTSESVADRIFELMPKGIEVGSNVPYAGKHHYGGVSARGAEVPQRRLWPEWRYWPTVWRERLMDEISKALTRMLIQMMSHELD